MLGRTLLVSMSDKRLGGIENSSLRYFSAMRALEVSISRMVNPSFSRRVRKLLPAGSITGLHESVGHHSRDRRSCVMNPAIILSLGTCYEFGTGWHPRPIWRNAILRPKVQYQSLMHPRFPLAPFVRIS